MPYRVAGRRLSANWPIYGKLWNNCSKRNADVDTAEGKDRQAYRRVYEGKERYGFRNQRRGV